MQVMYHLCSKNTIPIIQIEPAFSGKLDKCYANYNTFRVFLVVKSFIISSK